MDLKYQIKRQYFDQKGTLTKNIHTQQLATKWNGKLNAPFSHASNYLQIDPQKLKNQTELTPLDKYITEIKNPNLLSSQFINTYMCTGANSNVVMCKRDWALKQ